MVHAFSGFFRAFRGENSPPPPPILHGGAFFTGSILCRGALCAGEHSAAGEHLAGTRYNAHEQNGGRSS